MELPMSDSYTPGSGPSHVDTAQIAAKRSAGAAERIAAKRTPKNILASLRDRRALDGLRAWWWRLLRWGRHRGRRLRERDADQPERPIGVGILAWRSVLQAVDGCV